MNFNCNRVATHRSCLFRHLTLSYHSDVSSHYIVCRVGEPTDVRESTGKNFDKLMNSVSSVHIMSYFFILIVTVVMKLQ